MKDELAIFLRESNKIEGVYDNVSFEDSLRAWKYLAKHNVLISDLILKVHKILMTNQLLKVTEKGQWRTVDVMVGGQIKISPAQIIPRMNHWIPEANISQTEEEIKQDHINFEEIHPFVDGNGRIGRILMNWQRVKNNLPLLIIYDKDKQNYYQWFR